MMRRLVLTAGVTFLALAPVQTAAQRGWNTATCDLSTGHYLVNSAVLYLRNATTTRFPDQRQRDLRDAHRVLSQALEQGRESDPAVWYYLGRYHTMLTDLPGADSSFDRAVALAPACASDIRQYRRTMWVPEFNRGVAAVQSGDNDAAKEALRAANMIYDQEPPGFYTLAQIFANEGNPDSAVFYYRRTIAVAGDSLNADTELGQSTLRNSTFNTAVLFQRDLNYDSAAAWYQRYRRIDPDDPQALVRLAEVLSASGLESQASALYDTVLVRAGDLPALDVFATGVALFRGNRFERAARAFELGLERSPFYRDALFNLANTYLSLANDSATTAARKLELGGMMQPVIERLILGDPANTASMRLLAASFQLRDMQDSTLAVLERAQSLRYDITVSMFQSVGGGTWEIRGLITNPADVTVDVPALIFEFLSEAGDVVTAQTLDAQSVETAVPFGFRVEGEAIASWRYRMGT